MKTFTDSSWIRNSFQTFMDFVHFENDEKIMDCDLILMKNRIIWKRNSFRKMFSQIKMKMVNFYWFSQCKQFSLLFLEKWKSFIYNLTIFALYVLFGKQLCYYENKWHNLCIVAYDFVVRMMEDFKMKVLYCLTLASLAITQLKFMLMCLVINQRHQQTKKSNLFST